MNSAMPDSTHARGRTLRTLREQARLSRQDLADRVGIHHNTIQKLETGERKLSLEWIERLAPQLGVKAFDFVQLADGKKKTLPGNEQETVPPVSNVYSPEKWPLDLPVMGIGECGPEGFSLWNGEVIQMAPRPPSLAGVPKAYAVYVKGDSMEPRYFSGELVYINPARPAEPGDFVLVQMAPAEAGEPPRAFLKRLVRRSASKVTLEQYNPAQRIELKASEILSTHLVVGTGKP
jgi:phage repressor protein C with HTH and peptisase S24 domain